VICKGFAMAAGKEVVSWFAELSLGFMGMESAGMDDMLALPSGMWEPQEEGHLHSWVLARDMVDMNTGNRTKEIAEARDAYRMTQ
jgi:hypothetical protein